MKRCLAISLHCSLMLVLHSPSICITVCDSSLKFHSLVVHMTVCPCGIDVSVPAFPPKMFLSSLGTLKPAKYFCLHAVCGCCIKLQYFKAVRRQIKGTACSHIYGIQTCCSDRREYIAESGVYILTIIVVE